MINAILVLVILLGILGVTQLIGQIAVMASISKASDKILSELKLVRAAQAAQVEDAQLKHAAMSNALNILYKEAEANLKQSVAIRTESKEYAIQNLSILHSAVTKDQPKN